MQVGSSGLLNLEPFVADVRFDHGIIEPLARPKTS
jgi:hypothetical protein